MRIAVFGGSGFIGYHFVGAARTAGHEVTVFSGSRNGLANLCRHRVDLRFYQPGELPGLHLPDGTEMIVNLAYPAQARDGLSPERQGEAYGDLFLRLLQESPAARLAHVSTIAVYEPFANGAASEVDACLPPPSDEYAWAKLRLDQRLLQASPDRVSLIRPTMVYGPFGRSFTDLPLAALAAGDLPAAALAGRMQPVYVGDVAAVLLAQCRSFRGGVFNVAGPESMAWRDYFEFIASCVGRGKLTAPLVAGEAAADQGGGLRAALAEMRDLAETLAAHPAFRSMLRRLGRRLPPPLGPLLHRWGLPPAEAEAVDLSLPESDPAYDAVVPPASLVRECRAWIASGYFERHREVKGARLAAAFPEVPLTRLVETRGETERYFRFRFTDDVLEPDAKTAGRT